MGLLKPQLPDGLSARPGERTDAEQVLRLLQEWDLAETGEIDTDLADVQERLPAEPADPSASAASSLLVWAQHELVAATLSSSCSAR